MVAKINKKVKVLELFAGYGGCSFSLQKAGIEFECIGYSEIDKFAIKCYEQNHKDIKNYGDITKINAEELPDFDLLTGGFPCQSFSIAGKRKGFKDTRGTLFFDILRIAKAKKPKYMVLENVKGLLSHDDGKTFKIIIDSLKSIGYGIAYKVLNSKYYGIPQNRERIWIVCKYGGWDFMEFMFPNKEPLKITIKDILEKDVDKKYYLSEKQIKTILGKDGYSPCLSTNHTGKGLSHQMIIIPVLTPDRIEKRQNGRRFKTDGEPMFTLNTQDRHGVLISHSLFPRSSKTGKGGTGHLSKSDDTSYCVDTVNTQAIETNSIIRRLTPKECFRLQGFTEDQINLNGLSDSQKYKLAGNGWEIKVASKIFKNLLK